MYMYPRIFYFDNAGIEVYWNEGMLEWVYASISLFHA